MYIISVLYALRVSIFPVVVSTITCYTSHLQMVNTTRIYIVLHVRYVVPWGEYLSCVRLKRITWHRVKQR